MTSVLDLGYTLVNTPSTVERERGGERVGHTHLKTRAHNLTEVGDDSGFVTEVAGECHRYFHWSSLRVV